MSSSSSLPIGYWIKACDKAISDAVDAAQSRNGVTRVQWQTLNTLFDRGAATTAHLHGVLAPFIDEVELKSLLLEFGRRGWASHNEDGRWTLTADGKKVHSTILDVQREVRRRALVGISEEEYHTAVNVLQKIHSNVT